jgi:predicted nucleic acid-binding protein
MKIIFDNNIILDALLERKPFNESAEQILMACADTHKGCLSANSLTDIFYVLQKVAGAAEAKKAVKKLMDLLEIISVNEEDCQNALSLPINDFEDALVIICAKKAGADYIVTRDDLLLATDSPVTIVSPSKLLDIIK